MPDLFRHFVFVDLENVPSIDLAPIAGRPVHVTLLLGKNQTRVALPLVEQIKAFSAQVDLVKVGASGHNALDLVLAAHLGRASAKDPDAEFVIVSKDKDFDPLVAHLNTMQVRVSRHPDFGALPFFTRLRREPPPGATGAARRSPPPKAPAAEPRPGRRPASPANLAARRDNRRALDEKIEKLLGWFRSYDEPRPKKRKGLLNLIRSVAGRDLTDADVAALADELNVRRILAIGADDKVTYL
jgi:hypothetical protein